MLITSQKIYVLLMFQFLLIAISMVLQQIFLRKTSILVFTILSENSFYHLLLLLSGGISLNPGSFSNPQLLKQEKCQDFSNKGLDLIHLNINSLLPQIEELTNIVKRTKPSLMGI